MDKLGILRRYGLFDAKVPRYTSYPPANRFLAGVGARNQKDWLQGLHPDDPVSIYAHIPFCRRLCWFCACRTQGTKTLSPVKSYVDDLIREIEAVAALHPGPLPMARLHLGGGTPTLLNRKLMGRLLGAFHQAFTKTADFEFSVEIDPTEVTPGILEELAHWGMTRASIGVQDFDPAVQQAIGRLQSHQQTSAVVRDLRRLGVNSLNVDLLYGLPHQTADTLVRTLEQVIALQPDRIALYGYAHVPHVSKRQVMIPAGALPDAETRFSHAQLAKERLEALGFSAIGIDHFALPADSLAIAAKTGKMRRNFQGYTDDPCHTLIGFGASAISRTPQGYLQNAVSTAAYRARVQDRGLAAHKGYLLTPDDEMIACLIDQIMCDGAIDVGETCNRFPEHRQEITSVLAGLAQRFADILEPSGPSVFLRPELNAAARLIAADLDQSLMEHHVHSLAI